MDNQQPSSLSQLRPIRRPLYGRVGSIPPGGVTLVQPSPVVVTAPPPARVLSQTATQQPATRSAAEITPPAAQMMPATGSLVQRSESTPPALAPPAGAAAVPAGRPASPQVSGPESPVTIKADTVTRPPTPASLPRSAISHPVPEPNPPTVEPRKASVNGSSNGNGGASERGLWRRSPSQTPPSPPSPRNSGEEEVKRSFPNDTKALEGSKAGEKASGSVAAGFGMLTIAGENTGAYMELTNGGRRPWRGDVMDNGIRRQQGPNGNGAAGQPHRIPADAGVWAQQNRPDGESRNGSRKVAEEHSSASLHQTRPMSAVVNSNVQGINNSILHQSSCTHGSPGVHVTYSRDSNHNHRRRNGVHPTAESAVSRS